MTIPPIVLLERDRGKDQTPKKTSQLTIVEHRPLTKAVNALLSEIDEG
ncbi:hypothetical protein ACQCVM_05720 [Rossellomorea aquimaris]|nr:hypothetical protein [Bacillus sp. CH30_1T]